MSPPGPKIAAIIPAAGFGRRAGGPKLSLRIGDNSFLSIVYRTLVVLPVHPLIVVVQPPFQEWASRECPHGLILVNVSPERGMISSILLGARHAGTVQGFLIAPVDHPFTKAETCRLLIDEFNRHPESVILPEYQSRSGHPIIVPFSLLLREMPVGIEGGLQALIRQYQTPKITIPVDDPGILKNINYAQDMAAH